MAFEHDIFISYAHLDNEPLYVGQEGWISSFHHTLEIRLAQLLGKEPNVWRDPKLQGNDYFSDKIENQFPNVALFLLVLSPRYVKSEWCLKELQLFCHAAEKTGGVRTASNKSRIFKTIKTPIPVDKHPEEIQGLLGYNFFELNAMNRAEEYSFELGSEVIRKYLLKINDLAYDIVQLLEQLDVENESVNIHCSSDKSKVVYLAETSPSLTESRDKIRRELQMLGCEVLPDRPLPYSSKFSKVVREMLVRCDLSVHLLAGEDEFTSGGDEHSFAAQLSQFETVRLLEQLRLAAAYSKGTLGFDQILWLPSALEQERWQKEIATLQGDPDVLQAGLEELKTLVAIRLESRAKLMGATSSGERPQVYLDFDRRDFNSPQLEQLYDFLDEYFRVETPDYEEGEGLESSEEKLKNSDGVLIYYGQASGLWFKRRLNALRKSLSSVRAEIPRAVYVGNPITPSKEELNLSWLMVIRDLEGFSPELLQSFAMRMNQAQGG